VVESDPTNQSQEVERPFRLSSVAYQRLSQYCTLVQLLDVVPSSRSAQVPESSTHFSLFMLLPGAQASMGKGYTSLTTYFDLLPASGPIKDYCWFHAITRLTSLLKSVQRFVRWVES
jgi:hypothetical protein